MAKIRCQGCASRHPALGGSTASATSRCGFCFVLMPQGEPPPFANTSSVFALGGSTACKLGPFMFDYGFFSYGHRCVVRKALFRSCCPPPARRVASKDVTPRGQPQSFEIAATCARAGAGANMVEVGGGRGASSGPQFSVLCMLELVQGFRARFDFGSLFCARDGGGG